MIGTTLAHYEITAHLGSGGMGDVYRATDLTLKRDVAIKVLPAQVASDPDRLSRFRREAQLLASLNHPGIAHVYGLEESADTPCIVMELVEGETLQARLKRGAMPVGEALAVATQICEALEAAHENGVIHRDLKPGNVMLTPEGQVKVLDFGLAKALDRGSANGAQGVVDATRSPTMMTAVSMPGMVVGTAAYMSPEQAKGRSVDTRTDVFAFGCVLYEMLTGHRAFAGDDVADIVSAVLRLEPDWTRLPDGLPHGVRRLLRLCLEKNVKSRRGTATDVRLDLELAQSDADSVGPGVAATGRQPRLAWTVTAALGVVSVAALALAAFERGDRTPAAEVRATRFTLASPEGWTFANSNATPEQFAVSPDGSRVVLVGTATTGGQRLWVRDLDTLAARELAGTDGASRPFWSADGQGLGFHAEGEIRKVAVAGGPVITVCKAPDFRGGTWNQDGVILFGPASSSGRLGLQRVSAEGGSPTAVTALAAGETGHAVPRFLPDGRHFTFYAFGPNAIFLGSLDSTTHTPLIEAPVGPGVVYSQGHVLFLRGTTLMAQPFDERRLEKTGGPVPVAEGIMTVSRPDIGLFSASANGTLMFQMAGATADSQLTWFDRRGTALGTVETPGQLGSVALSPDGSRVAFSRASATRNEDVWVHEFARGTSTRLTSAPGQDWMPVWSPDGRRVVWESERRGPNFRDLYLRPADGAGDDEVLLQSPIPSYPYDWSRDGRVLVYADLVSTRVGRYQLWMLPMTGDDRGPRRYLETSFDARDARFAPDGRHLAYMGNESGRNEVYVQPFPDAAGGKWVVSQGGGAQPRWRRDGKELFYLSADSRLMSVDVAADGAFTPTAPKALFEVSMPRGAFSALYDVTADGHRFLVNALAPGEVAPRPSPVIVVLQWTAGLTPSPVATNR